MATGQLDIQLMTSGRAKLVHSCLASLRWLHVWSVWYVLRGHWPHMLSSKVQLASRGERDAYAKQYRQFVRFPKYTFHSILGWNKEDE